MVCQWKESDRQLGLQALQKDPKSSIRSIARLYNVPPTTLRHRYHGGASPQDTRSATQKLTNSDEDAIVQ